MLKVAVGLFILFTIQDVSVIPAALFATLGAFTYWTGGWSER